MSNMITLKDDIENLDRMFDGDTPKDKVRSQIRLIAREAAALEADYASLAESHAKLQESHTKLKEAHSKRDDAGWNEFIKEAEEQHRNLQKRLLNRRI
jgi:hypothetical protein